tara:strand:+ start:948 stop:1178 length:231 start_codon:yes stop_codon:yes gene_type:complete
MTSDILIGNCPNGCEIDLDVIPQYTVGRGDARKSHYEIYCDSCGYNAIIRRGVVQELNNAESEYSDYFADYINEWE